MLIIKYKNEYELSYHIPFGQKEKFFKSQLDTIVKIQADGDELDHILSQYQNPTIKEYSIPVPLNKQVVVWYGDIAKTIIANL